LGCIQSHSQLDRISGTKLSKSTTDGKTHLGVTLDASQNPNHIQLDQTVDTSDPALKAAFKDLTDIKTETNWILFQFADDGKSNKLEPRSSGKGGFKEIKNALYDCNGRVVFGAFCVIGKDKRESGVTSTRYKYVAFNFVGSAVADVVKAHLNLQKSKVQRALFPSVHLTLDLSGDVDTVFSQSDIAKKLNEGGGAHKVSHFDFGDGNEVDVAKLIKGDDEDEDEDFD